MKKVIHVWLVKRDKKNNEHRYKTLLDFKERQTADVMSAQVRIRFIETKAKLRWILATYLKVDAKTLLFSQEQHGKPFLPEYPNCYFNLSHSGDQLAIAVTDYGPVGIDVEQWKQKSNFFALVKRCFAETEQSYWLALPESEKTKEFYRFWTRKEAFVKATGRGIGLGLSQCVISSENPSRFLCLPDDYGPASHWRIHDLELPEGLSGAVAVQGTDLKIRIKNIDDQ